MPTDVRRRLLRGTTATSLSPLVTAAIQLGTVPLLLHAWGAAKYGDWLVLSAIPSYLSLTNLGFGDASGSDMTVRVAAGDREGALRTFQSSWALLNVLSVAVLAIVVSTVWWLPLQKWLHLSSVGGEPVSWIIAVLAFYVVACQQVGILESGYRCDGNFAIGTFWATMMRLTEALAACGVGVLTGRLLWMSITYLAIRLVGILCYEIHLRKLSSWLRLGLRHASLPTIRQLALPAGGFVALSLGYALCYQGYTILIGITLGSSAVAAFSTLRTLSRVGPQCVLAISFSVWPELSRAIGGGDRSLARMLHHRAFLVTLFASLIAMLVLWFFGPFAYEHWVRKAVAFDPLCFHLLLAASVANALWSADSVVAMSVNRHQSIATAFLLVTGVSLAVARFLLPSLGVSGSAVSILLGDVVLIWVALRTSLSQLQESPAEFARGLLRFAGVNPGPGSLSWPRRGASEPGSKTAQ